MEQHLDDLGRQVATARQAYDKEQREAEQIEALSHQRMAASEQLQGQVATEADPTRRAALERSLETLVSMLEQMAPEIDREKQDATDAKEFLEMLENAYAQAGGKLKQARSELERAQRDMVRAGQQRETAERQAEAARQAAGLTRTTSSLTVALNAMQEAAQRDLASADAATAKAKLLRPTRPEQDDPNIAAAMAAASGKSPAPQSLSERLAALRARAET
jgi:chromosome segregation ATPase